MDNNELLQAIRQIVKEETQEIKDRTQRIEDRVQKIENRTQKIEDRTQRIEDRTLKIEVTIENETNRNISLLMEAQSINTEKLNEIPTNTNKIDKIETDLFAVSQATKHNKEEIDKLKIKIG